MGVGQEAGVCQMTSLAWMRPKLAELCKLATGRDKHGPISKSRAQGLTALGAFSRSEFCMNVIITGSPDSWVAVDELDSIVARSGFKISGVVSLGGRGVDRSGEHWAIENDLPIKVIRPDTVAFGKAAQAGHIQDLAAYGDALIAIWDGKSPTIHALISAMRRRGKPVHIFRPNNPFAVLTNPA